MLNIAPILKWAGGKRQLLSEILPLVPQHYDTYYEPFVGAGAVLFGLHPSKAVINDANTELIAVYKVIKDNPSELIDLLTEYEKKHCDDHYYSIRDLDRNAKQYKKLSQVEKAARTIYLNRTCYNGLYRVNRKGFFNTPIGRNTSIQIVNRDGIMKISNYLNSADITILSGDYQESIKDISKNDFVFLDPPYYPTNRDSFTRYDISPFGISEQESLKKLCDTLTRIGVPFIETNSDCEEIRDLYSQYRLIEVDVRRSINAKSDCRRGKELIILNY